MGISWWHWLILALFLVPKALYLWSQQRTFTAIPAAHRTFAPAFVWLGLIPLVYIVWNFIVVWGLKKSLVNYSTVNPSAKGEDGGFIAGMISSIAVIALPLYSILTNDGPAVAESPEQEPDLVPLILATMIIMAWLGGWIVNWIQIVSVKGRISST